MIKEDLSTRFISGILYSIPKLVLVTLIIPISIITLMASFYKSWFLLIGIEIILESIIFLVIFRKDLAIIPKVILLVCFLEMLVSDVIYALHYSKIVSWDYQSIFLLVLSSWVIFYLYIFASNYQKIRRLLSKEVVLLTILFAAVYISRALLSSEAYIDKYQDIMDITILCLSVIVFLYNRVSFISVLSLGMLGISSIDILIRQSIVDHLTPYWAFLDVYWVLFLLAILNSTFMKKYSDWIDPKSIINVVVSRVVLMAFSFSIFLLIFGEKIICYVFILGIFIFLKAIATFVYAEIIRFVKEMSSGDHHDIENIKTDIIELEKIRDIFLKFRDKVYNKYWRDERYLGRVKVMSHHIKTPIMLLEKSLCKDGTENKIIKDSLQDIEDTVNDLLFLYEDNKNPRQEKNIFSGEIENIADDFLKSNNSSCSFVYEDRVNDQQVLIHFSFIEFKSIIEDVLKNCIENCPDRCNINCTIDINEDLLKVSVSNAIEYSSEKLSKPRNSGVCLKNLKSYFDSNNLPLSYERNDQEKTFKISLCFPTKRFCSIINSIPKNDKFDYVIICSEHNTENSTLAKELNAEKSIIKERVDIDHVFENRTEYSSSIIIFDSSTLENYFDRPTDIIEFFGYPFQSVLFLNKKNINSETIDICEFLNCKIFLY
tara:strand:- start:1697 stop:3667 length:1971 start_codon:yes stop_codon:yes gene_type:complete